MSKRIGLFVAVGLLIALAVPAFAQGAFEDVPMDHWAYQAVETLTQAGLIEGYPDGEFKGNQPMTRYEFAMIIARALQSGALAGPPGPPGPSGTPGRAGEVAAGAAGLTPEQSALLAKLQKEFMPELKRLRSNLDELEVRVSELEGKPSPGKPKVQVSGDISVRTGLLGTKLEIGASEATAYPYPGIGGPYETYGGGSTWWFDPVAWGGINIPNDIDDDGSQVWSWDWLDGALSVPISDALKDSFKAPDFMTMRTRVIFDATLGSGVTARAVILADPRGNLIAPAVEADPSMDDGVMSNSTPNMYYSDGLMDTVRMDEAWLKYNTEILLPITLTAGKQYWGFGCGLLANNSQQATKSLRVDAAVTGDAPGDGITLTAVMGMLDREAFGGYTALLPRWPDPNAVSGVTRNGGMDNYAIYSVAIPIGGDWKIAGNYLATGFGSEQGWSVDLTGKFWGLDLWGEWATLTSFPDGTDQTGADTPVDLDEEDNAWIVGLGWSNNDLAVRGQYGVVEPLYAICGFDKDGWDPVGLGAMLTGWGGSPATNGYLNLPLSLLHPVEEFNPHFVNWVDRPLFLDATNVARGYEVALTLKRLLGERTPVSIRYYDGDAYTEEYLGWLFNDGGDDMSEPDKWRDADPVWALTISHRFTDSLTASLTYGQREVDNVMSPNNPELTQGEVDDDPIKVLRLDLSVAF
jgi:hypothetical protein